MKTWMGLIATLTISMQAAAFAVHDKKVDKKKNARQMELAQVYGPPVKMDLSGGNQCVEKGDKEYPHVLFYEEFQTLKECLKARKRG